MSTAFKEWALVCEALGSGRQSVIIRKGGIAEGNSGFSFQHQEFLLFPTWFHEQLEKTTLPPETDLPEAPGGELEIRYAATVEWSRQITDLNVLQQLRGHHIWQDSVLEERFRYEDTPGVHVAYVRIFRLDPPKRLKNEKRFGGCRSWVELPEIEGSALVSVLSDEENERRKKLIESLLGL